MDLTPQELRELATFFAKRLSPELDPLDPTDPPPPGDPGAAWFALLESAQRAGTLPELARKVAAANRSDRNLQQACNLLTTGEGSMESLALGAVIATGAAVALLAITGAGLFLGIAGLAGAPDLAAAPPAEPEVQLALQPQSLAPEAPSDTDEPLAEVAHAAAKAGQTVDEATIAAVEATHAPPPSSERCARSSDGIVGYWYAGAQPPGRAGDLVVVPHAVNVRADYPNRGNRFDARSTVRCVLEAGDTVRLSRDPIAVPKDRYWVPLFSGDVVSTTS